MSRITSYFGRLIRFVIKGQPIAKTYVRVGANHIGELLVDKNIVITGGSSGIGYAIARKCLMEKGNVLIVARNREKMENAVAGLKEESDSSKVKGIVWDITDIDNCRERSKASIDLLGGKVDYLINSAGVTSHKNYLDCTPEEWDRIFDTNLKGLFYLTREFIEQFKVQKTGGNIIMIASQAGLNVQSRPYALSKAALLHLSSGLAKELLEFGIRVNAIAPGPTVSDMYQIDPDGDLTSIGRSKRAFLPEEMAETALFLMSDASKCITGEVIACNGGNSLRTDAFS